MSYSSEGQCPQLVCGQLEDGFAQVVSHPDSKHFLALSHEGAVSRDFLLGINQLTHRLFV